LLLSGYLLHPTGKLEIGVPFFVLSAVTISG